MSKKFVSVAVDSEDQIVLNKENYDLFATFNDRLREKIIETAAILLQENLFDYTFAPISEESPYYRNSFDFWKSAKEFEIEFYTTDTVYLNLTRWGSYGAEDDTISCTFNSNLLFSNMNDDVFVAAIEQRDRNLARYNKEELDKKELKKNAELEEKRKLLEKLKKELGE